MTQLYYQTYYLMPILLCSQKIHQTVDMAESVCSFNFLPIKVRNDLSFEESIVVKLKFGRKKIFFTVLYRSPAFNHTSPEFLDFLSNFTNLYSKIKTKIHIHHFLLGTLMDTPSFGGLKVTQRLRVGKLKIF